MRIDNVIIEESFRSGYTALAIVSFVPELLKMRHVMPLSAVIFVRATFLTAAGCIYLKVN